MPKQRKTKVSVEDIPNILKLLETKSYAQIADIYGYESSLSRGGAAIRNFLQKHGYNPKIYNKGQPKPKQSCFGNAGGMFTSPEHFIETVYYEDGQKIRRYESRLRLNPPALSQRISNNAPS